MRCVICHPATAALPGELLTSLSKRMGRMTICADIFSALAECCLIQRERADLPPGSGTGPGAVLVLVHPRHIPDGGGVRLVEAVRQYAPSISLWCYDRGANPKLRAVVEEDVTSAFALPTPPSPPTVVTLPMPIAPSRPNGEFIPKLVNGTGHGPHVPIARPARPSNGSSLLTEDELRMLLSGDPLDSGPLPIRPARPPNSPYVPPAPQLPGQGGAS